MYSVGVTGGIGSGKSTVCRVFSVLGIPVFSSDDEAKRLLDGDPATKQRLREVFGDAVFTGGKPDRKALAARVFNDAEALQRLNAIVHPAVREAFARWARRQNAPYVINEAAILVETGAYRTMDHLVVVTAPEQERVRRVMLRDGGTEAAVRARMRNQADEAALVAVAGSVIVNDGASLVIPQVLHVHGKLLQWAEGK